MVVIREGYGNEYRSVGVYSTRGHSYLHYTRPPSYSHAPTVLSQPTEAVKMRKIGYSHDTSKAIILTQTNSPPPPYSGKN